MNTNFTNSLSPVAQNITGALQRLLGNTRVNVDGGEYSYGTVKGEYNYDFTFRLEGAGHFQQTGILV